MRPSVLLLAIAVGCSSAEPNAPTLSADRPPRTVSAMALSPEKLSNVDHPVSTSSAAAQQHFNDGLAYIYGFNHDQAVRSFEKALAADAKLAMAHWGIALALGPNYNLDVDAEREKKAHEHITRAAELAQNNPQVERDYIATLARRFSGDEDPDLKKLARDYADAAQQLMKKYPDDLDAATLAADALMCLRPWALYDKNYQPVEGTEELVAILESVLKRDPDHLGACHLYIHAVEASTSPQRALEAAARLPTLAPELGHLVHMPSHIYARVGEHEASVTSNEAAVEADRAYFRKHPEGRGGIYEMMYYPHNMHFIAFAQAWQGNWQQAKKWADETYEHAAPHVPHMAMMEMFTVVPMQLAVKFGKWDEIVSANVPDEQTMPNTAAFHHFARGMAFAQRGDFGQARSERDKITAIKKSQAADALLGMLNKVHHVLGIAEHTLDAKIAAKQKDYALAEKLLREAVELEDNLVYMEPPDWLLPSREALGGVLLASGNYVKAEKVFREDLERSPRGGRALFGLMTALKKQGRDYEAGLVERRFQQAWKNADTTLTVEG